jgi:hypothetical protein
LEAVGMNNQGKKKIAEWGEVHHRGAGKRAVWVSRVPEKWYWKCSNKEK